MTQITFSLKDLLQAEKDNRLLDLVWAQVARVYKDQVNVTLVADVLRVVQTRLLQPSDSRPDSAQKLVVHVTPPVQAKVGGSEWVQEVRV